MHLSRVHRGGESYYLKTVGAEPEDLEGPGDPGGRWTGAGSVALGLQGGASAAELRAVMAGAHPGTGEMLGVAHSRVRVAAWDLTFAAPKAVSVLWGTADRPTAAAIAAAHHRSVASTVAYLERRGLYARRQSGGASVSVGVSGAVAAAFPHRLSRAADPHLHTHVLLANLVEGQDGRWTALDAGRLFAERRTAGLVYNAELRHRLGVDLGCRFACRQGLPPSLVGVPEPVVREMSTRRADVERQMAEWTAEGARAARHAALATRGPKEPRPDVDGLRESWRERCSRAAPTWHPSAATHPEADVEPVKRNLGAEELAEVAAGGTGFFRRTDMVAALALSLPQGAEAGWLDRTADAVIDEAGTPVPARRNGRYSVWAPPSSVEAARRIASRSFGQRPSVDRAALESGLRSALERRPGLADEEVAALTALAKVETSVAVVAMDGPVWSSPDLLDGVRAMFEAAGSEVRLVAPTEAMAQSWSVTAGFENGTSVQRPIRPGSVGSVTVVAGAEMMSPVQLALLGEASAPAGTVVMLAGKWTQQAGAHRLLARAAGGAGSVVHVPVRSSGPTVQVGDATSVRPSLRMEVDGATVVLAPTSAELRREVVDDWVKGSARPRSEGELGPTLVTPDASTASICNAAVRERLTALGKLGGPTRMGGLELAPGDVVRAARPGRQWASLNGVHTVVSCSPDGVLLRSGSGEERTLLRSEVRRRGLHHAYAMTPAQARRSGRRPTMSLGPAVSLVPAVSLGPATEVSHGSDGPGADPFPSPAQPPGRSGRAKAVTFYAVAGGETGTALDAVAKARAMGLPEPPTAMRQLLGRAAEVALPDRLVGRLGRPPRGVAALSAWRRAAGSAVAFEQRWGVDRAGSEQRAGPDHSGSDVAPADKRAMRAEKADVERNVRIAVGLGAGERSLGRAPGPSDRSVGRSREMSLRP